MFPRWLAERLNMREVAPGLYVGDSQSVSFGPARKRWGFVADLCGSSRNNADLYPRTAELFVHRFEDGTPVPRIVLETVAQKVPHYLAREQPVLIHCAAGESRSVSVAYALLRIGWGLDHDEALLRVQTPNSIPCGWPVPRTFESAREWVEGRRRRR